jgi:hypothetical protein
MLAEIFMLQLEATLRGNKVDTTVAEDSAAARPAPT